MSLWIKICGNTNVEDAQLATELGANALGFLFAPSPRRVSIEQAASIIAPLPASVEKIGIFVNATLTEITETVAQTGLTGAQIHTTTDSTLAQQLRQQLPQLRIIQVAHFAPDQIANCAAEAAILNMDPATDAILIDSRTATAVGGTGIAFDWHAAREQVFQHLTKPTIVAGGLNPANVAEAIQTLQPWGIDAVSGVEAAPGKKDPAKLRAFIQSARSTN